MGQKLHRNIPCIHKVRLFLNEYEYEYCLSHFNL